MHKWSRRAKKLLTLSALEDGHLAELRHDFRREYGTRYDDVPTDEAIDLVRTLGPWTAYASAVAGYRGWEPVEHRLADLTDSVLRLTHMLSDARTTEGAPTVPRPGSGKRAAEAKKRAARAREYIENQEWEAVDG